MGLFQGNHVNTRDHDFPYRGVLELQRTGQHLLFLRFDGTFLGSHMHGENDFIFRDKRGLFDLVPSQQA